jgi:hypothetical protein
MDHHLTLAEKDRLLLRVIRDHPATVRAELLRRFREQSTPAVPSVPRRTVADLLDTAAGTHAERERRAAAQRADEKIRRENIRALARERRLDELAHGEETAWARIDTMIATRKPGEYDAAVALLTELRALAERKRASRRVHPVLRRATSDALAQSQPHRALQPSRRRRNKPPRLTSLRLRPASFAQASHRWGRAIKIMLFVCSKGVV